MSNETLNIVKAIAILATVALVFDYMSFSTYSEPQKIYVNLKEAK